MSPRARRWSTLGLALLLGAAVPQRDPADAQAVIARCKEKDPGLAKVFAQSRGYAVFPTVGKGGIGIGGARGKGYVYERGRLIGRSTLTQVSIGLQLGGQAYSQIIFFEDQRAFDECRRFL